MYDYVIAAALLMTPLKHDELRDVPHHVIDAIERLSIDWELLDPKECVYYFSSVHRFTSDLNTIRERNVRLLGVPFVVDLKRFPDKATIVEFLAFNRAYRQTLEKRPNSLAVRQALKETDCFYVFWYHLQEAQDENYYVADRRTYLKLVMADLGEDNYYNGVLPPYVPLWRFERCP